MFSIGFDVTESVTVDKEVSEVYKSLQNFDEWPRWSPWLCQEPDCPVTVEGAPGSTDHKQGWNGDFIGSGSMQIKSASENEKLDYDLNFIKPWKAHADVGFKLSPEGAGTRIEWWMNGNLPFFLFFMKNKMKAFVGSDYKRGLKMLKEYLENGNVPTATAVEGVVERPSAHYVGKRRSSAMADIGDAMSADLTELSKMADDGRLPKPGGVFSVYHSFDMVKGTTEYTTGFTYESAPEAPADLETGELPAHKALLVKHTGPYRHVGNAWAAAMGATRVHHKVNKGVDPYEVYSNDPHAVAEAEIETEVYIPVKR